MPHKVRVSEEAVRQIQTIGDYIARDSQSHANLWIRGIKKAIETLGEHPERHPIAYTHKQAGREVRRSLYGVYSILYAIEGDTVHVLSVRHVARRPQRTSELKRLS